MRTNAFYKNMAQQQL